MIFDPGIEKRVVHDVPMAPKDEWLARVAMATPPNLFEIWRCRRDLERDSRSPLGKDNGGSSVRRDALTYRGPIPPVFDPFPRGLFGHF